jgi:hypothetical protein
VRTRAEWAALSLAWLAAGVLLPAWFAALVWGLPDSWVLLVGRLLIGAAAGLWLCILVASVCAPRPKR